MQQHNDQIISVTRQYGKDGKPQVQHPVPAKACMRAEFVYDNSNPIMPGSTLAINRAVFKSTSRTPMTQRIGYCENFARWVH